MKIHVRYILFLPPNFENFEKDKQRPSFATSPNNLSAVKKHYPTNLTELKRP